MNEFFYLTDLYLRNTRHAELLKEAEMMRLVSQCWEKRLPLHIRTLNQLGAHLVAWGERLQKRYSSDECCPTPST